MSVNWYHSKNGAPVGPIPFEQLQQLARNGQLQPSELVWSEAMPNWVAAETVPGLIVPPEYTPPTYATPTQQAAAPAFAQPTHAFSQPPHAFAQPVGYASPNMTGQPPPAGFAVASMVLGIL